MATAESHQEKVQKSELFLPNRKIWLLWSSVKAAMECGLGIIISEQAVRCRLYEVGFKGRAVRRKPYMDKTNRIKSVEYARKYREKPSGFSDHVLWTDESRISLFDFDGSYDLGSA